MAKLMANIRKQVDPNTGFLGKQPGGEGKIANRELAWHALGLAGQNSTCGMIGGHWLFYYCNTVLGLPSEWVGRLTSISRLWDGINDPMAGTLIDRHRFKSGEKLRPLIKYCAPLIGVFGTMIFFDFGFKSQMATIALISVFYLLYDTVFSFQDIALWGMTSVMSPLSQERTRAAQWARIGASLGWLPLNLIQPILGLRDKLPEGSPLTMQRMFFIMAILFCFGGSMLSSVAAKAQERIPAPDEENGSIRENLGAITHNHILLLLVLGSILGRAVPALDGMYLYQDRSYDVFGTQMTGELFSAILGTVTGIPGMAAMFFANAAAKKLGGMKNVLIVANAANIVTRTLGYFTGYQTAPRLIVTFLINMISSVPSNMTSIAATSLWGDSIDYMEWKTGKRTEGVAFSMQIFIVKCGDSISNLLRGEILKALKYEPAKAQNRVPQNPLFQKWVWPLHQLVPMLGALLNLIPILFIRYTKEQKLQVEAELAERRALIAQDIRAEVTV